MYLSEDDVRQLLQRLTGRFPQGEMIFDVMSGFVAKFSRMFGYSLWGLSDPHELERWNPKLTLLDDTRALADYKQIPLRSYRVYSGLMNMIPGYNNMIRPLRYRFGTA
jgi:O-methyltransferase involved in polyketide biosynthesis